MLMTTGAARHHQSINFRLSLRCAALLSSHQIVIPQAARDLNPPIRQLAEQNLMSGLGVARPKYTLTSFKFCK